MRPALLRNRAQVITNVRYVLIVDDDAATREFLRLWLEDWGYRVKEAGSASKALEVMLAEPASIAMLDIRMPGHDGLWLAEQIHARWKETAIIMASSVDHVPTVMNSRQPGVVDYVSKPFEQEKLLQALQRAHANIQS